MAAPLKQSTTEPHSFANHPSTSSPAEAGETDDFVDTGNSNGMNDGMPTMTHRTTFALDEATSQRLKRLAKRWNVSQAEVVRRSVDLAERQASRPDPDAEERIQTARRLRESLKGRVSSEDWLAMIRDARR